MYFVTSTPKEAKNFVERVVFDHFKGKTGIIIDPKRYWTSHSVNENIRLFQPTNLEHFIEIISNLSRFLHPRLAYILIDDFPYYLRDYQGRSAKQTMINTRIFAALVAILGEYASEYTRIIGMMYENTFSEKNPIMGHVLKYYSASVYYVDFTANHAKLEEIK